MSGIFTKKKWFKLILLVFAFSLMLSGCGHKRNTATVTNRTGSAFSNDEQEAKEDAENVIVTDSSDLYIVEELDMGTETISLYSCATAKQLRYNYNMTTKFLDKYGDSASWASFTPGTVVNIGEKLPVSGAISEVKKSPDVWVYEDVTNYEIDATQGIFTIADSNYKITTSSKAYSDNERILMSDIGENDTLNVIGQDKEIISVSVTTGHGYIKLTNTSLFNNSLIFIGNKIVTMVYGDSTIEVPEGTYDITVANDGWGGTGEYTVVRNQETEVSLEDLKGEGPSYCDLTFLVTVPDTYVYLDGNLIDTNEVQSVRYGSHKLVVQCSGYTSWDKTLVVNSKSATITLALEEDTDTTSTSESNTESDGDSTTTDEDEESDDSDDAAENAQQIVDDTTSSTDDYDYETDYLSTISDMLSTLMN